MITGIGLSHVGRVRQTNQDRWLLVPISEAACVALVADGVGGHVGGEIASARVVETVETLANAGHLGMLQDPAWRDDVLLGIAHRAHAAIGEHAREHPTLAGMASTLTLAVLTPSECRGVQVGDSRLYRFSAKEGLQQITQDQTLAQGLFEAGRITRDQLATHPDRHLLSQCLGLENVDEPLQPVLFGSAWQPGDLMLLCTDGLSNDVSALQIETILTANEPPTTKAQQLLQAALDNGGKDNITLVMMTQE